MAKVKSTIDLIMEKTKNMSLNEEERMALKRQDLEERVKLFTYRFLKEERDSESLVNELKKIPEEEQEEAVKICFAVLLGEFSPLDEESRALHGIKKIIHKIPEQRVHTAIGEVCKEFKIQEGDLRNEAASQCRRELESEGIRGSALVPCIEATSFWQVGSKELIDASREALREKLEGAL